MTQRFFKLLYALALIAIVLWLPIHLLSSIHWDWITITSYKAKCLSNNQDVVLQGSQLGEAWVMDEVFLNGENRTSIKERLNFYCKYYDEIQPHIATYLDAKTFQEKAAANRNFTLFEATKDKVYSYPELYKLEVVSEENRPQEIYSPLIEWLIYAIALFILLQIIRICYVYVVFGKLVWHPFRKIN